MAPMPCLSRIVSLLALITSLGCALVEANGRMCTLENRGFLKSFKREFAKVSLPCKYRLADFTCGDYRVKLTPGSSLDMDYTFSPARMWVKVVNTVTNDTVKLRTSQELMEKVQEGKIDNVWKVKEGDTDFLDFFGYDRNTARLKKNGVFTINFMPSRAIHFVCEAPEFSSPGVPETLCGDGSTTNEFEAAKSAMFGDEISTVEEFVLYVTLNDPTITQSKNCAALASDFQRCGDKTEVISNCHQFFTDVNVVRCLVGIGTSPEAAFDSCLRQICYDDDSDRPDLDGELSRARDCPVLYSTQL